MCNKFRIHSSGRRPLTFCQGRLQACCGMIVKPTFFTGHEPGDDQFRKHQLLVCGPSDHYGGCGIASGNNLMLDRAGHLCFAVLHLRSKGYFLAKITIK